MQDALRVGHVVHIAPTKLVYTLLRSTGRSQTLDMVVEERSGWRL